MQAMEESSNGGSRFRRIPRQSWAASLGLDPGVCFILRIVPFFIRAFSALFGTCG